MIIRVEQGKGSKDRNAMLSPTLLNMLHSWYRFARVNNGILPVLEDLGIQATPS